MKPKTTNKPGRPALPTPKVTLSTTVLPTTLAKLKAEAEARNLKTPGQVIDDDYKLVDGLY